MNFLKSFSLPVFLATKFFWFDFSFTVSTDQDCLFLNFKKEKGQKPQIKG